MYQTHPFKYSSRANHDAENHLCDVMSSMCFVFSTQNGGHSCVSAI